MKRIAVLGSTGSIGRQTLDVVRWHPDEFQVMALVAGRPSETFDSQVHEFTPAVSCLTSIDGPTRLVDIATRPDVDLLVAQADEGLEAREELRQVEVVALEDERERHGGEAGGRQHHGHHVPPTRHRVAEGMHDPMRLVERPVGGGSRCRSGW